MRTFRIFAAACSLLIGTAALAQDSPPEPAAQGEEEQLVVDVTGGQRAALPIAVPYMPTPQAADTAAGNTQALGRQVAETVVADF